VILHAPIDEDKLQVPSLLKLAVHIRLQQLNSVGTVIPLSATFWRALYGACHRQVWQQHDVVLQKRHKLQVTSPTHQNLSHPCVNQRRARTGPEGPESLLRSIVKTQRNVALNFLSQPIAQVH
jgi:hypothetical protein